MHITLNAKQFTKSLDLVTRFVSNHATLPILENIYLGGFENRFTLKGTDMEKHIQLSMSADITQEGSITVNAKTLQNIIKSIEEEEIEIIVGSDESITIKSTQDKFKIKGIPSTEYVALPEIQSDKEVIIDTSTLIEGISKIEYTISEKNFSPVLTGLLIKTAPDSSSRIAFAGSDSFRLAEYQTEINGVTEPFSIIIPKTNITDIQKVFEYQEAHGGAEVVMHISDNMIAFVCPTEDGTEIMATSLLIQGNFPNYNNEAIIPTSHETAIITDKKQLEKAIKKILILTRDINNYILIKTSTDSLTITSGETDKGAANTSIPAIITGKEQEIGINGKYISDFIRQTQSDEIHIHMIDNQKPLILKDPLTDNYIYVARPLLK